ncbi:MAG TPA: HAMP domain-containing protein [Chromatiaceae bacterium]|nr:HAMP domain-containing protein [Chromatiaceae bacterium]
MAAAALKSWRSRAWAVALLLLLLLFALHFLSGAVLRSEELSRWFIPLLVFIVIGLVTLSIVVAVNLVRLLRDYRRNEAGARFMARLVVMFVLLGLAPVGIVYYYSLQFLMQGIDSWFNVQIDSAMADALELNQATLNMNKRLLLRYTEQMLENIDDSSQTALTLALSDLRSRSGATEVALATPQGEILASSHVNPEVLVPNAPDPLILQQVISGKNDVQFVTYGETGELYIRALVADLSRGLVFQAIFPTSERISELSENVQTAYAAYRQRAYLRESIKFSFILALSLVLLVGIFAAAWAAFYTSRRMVAPIQAIAEGTRAIADGELDGRIPVPRYHDELGFLVASFNAMTRRLAQARDMAERSKRALEFQREYLEAVLHHLSTGVVALDADGNLRTANRAAEQILEADVSRYMGRPFASLARDYPELEALVNPVASAMDAEEHDWRKELVLNRSEGRQFLMCGYTRLQVVKGSEIGCVVVFDDVTTLVKAQRDAAWGEVARRLAHEIKNPLTPIQLSAERLRRKYLDKLPEDDRKVLDSATRTIVNQVEAMKSMVNAFSDYAKPSRLDAQPLLADDFLADVLALYGGSVDFEAGAPGATMEVDPVRFRQVVHNLVKNAQEATQGIDRPEIRITTGVYQPREQEMLFLQILVEDNGSGFEEADTEQLFEPYTTRKEKGTGLGLAIVKKIIEEHGGSIRAENRAEGGARFILRLPAKYAQVPEGASGL